MAIEIPIGWRELKIGEEIILGDKFSSFGIKPFVEVKTKIGRKYKVNSGHNVKSVVIRKDNDDSQFDFNDVIISEVPENKEKIIPKYQKILQEQIKFWRPRVINCIVTDVNSPERRNIIKNFYYLYFGGLEFHSDSGNYFYILLNKDCCGYLREIPREINNNICAPFNMCKIVSFDDFKNWFTPPTIEQLIKKFVCVANINFELKYS